jgi:hypothetical protein
MSNTTRSAVIYNSFKDLSEFLDKEILEGDLILRGSTFIHWTGDHTNYYDMFFVQGLEDVYRLAGKVFDRILYLSDHEDTHIKEYCDTRVRVV